MLTSADTQRITTVLRQFGCTPRDTQIYLYALGTGPISVQQLAKGLRQNRVTVHSAVEKLIEHGLLYETRKGKRRLIVAEEPAILHRLIQQRENELSGMRANVEYVTKLLASIQRTDQSVPSVKFYEGVDGLKKMLEETLGATSEVLVFTYVDLFAKLLNPRYLENYYAKRAKKGIRTRLIFPAGEFGKRVHAKAAEYKMQIRFLPPEVQWKSGIFSWNNIVAIQSFTEGRVTCTIIENDDIAFFYRHVIYELCWKQAQPLGA